MQRDRGQASWARLSAIPWKGEVACLVVVGEVAEASHPDIAGDKHPDGIVHFFGLKVVVQQKEHLHTQTDRHASTHWKQSKGRRLILRAFCKGP